MEFFLEKVDNNYNSVLTDDYSVDYVNENIFEEESKIEKELFKKRVTMVSLGAFYVLLFVVSFTLLS